MYRLLWLLSLKNKIITFGTDKVVTAGSSWIREYLELPLDREMSRGDPR